MLPQPGRRPDPVWTPSHLPFALLPHYPRAPFAVLDVAGHHLQIEQPVLFDALLGEGSTAPRA